MTTPQRRLKTTVEHRGWEIVEVIDENLPWWAYQVWVVESRWSPTDVRLRLTFVVHPLADDGPMRGWLDRAVISWDDLPSCYSTDELAEMSMRHGWERDLEAFVGVLDRLRTERA